MKLTISNITKFYKKRCIIKDINIEVNSGEVVGLLGPNGAGKTTIFCIIIGIIHTDRGGIFINNQNISTLPIYDRAYLGLNYLPQEPSIFRHLSVLDNIMSILQLQKNLNKKQRKERVVELMKDLNITHISSNLGKFLSGGERRRVEIARSLATNPKFILLDEPFAGVDPISISDIKNIIRYLCIKKIGVLITDHNVRDTLDICKKVYIVNHGRIIANGSSREILLNRKVKQVYLGEDFYF